MFLRRTLLLALGLALRAGADEPDLSTPERAADCFYASTVRNSMDEAARCVLEADRADFEAGRGALHDEWLFYATLCAVLRLGAPPPADGKLPVPVEGRDVFRYGDLARVRTIVIAPILGTVHLWAHCRLTDGRWHIAADRREFLLAATSDWLTTESDHIRYHHTGADAISRDVVEYHERHLDRLREALGLELPERIDYFYAANEEEAHWIGCAGNEICWGIGTCVGAVLPKMAHEITHAALPFQQGEDWIGEGLAECYGTDWDHGSPEAPVDPRTRLRRFRQNGALTVPFGRHLRTSMSVLLALDTTAVGELYMRSGAMVQFLAERYGPEKLRAFIRRAGVATVERDLQETYGLTPQEFERQWMEWLQAPEGEG